MHTDRFAIRYDDHFQLRLSQLANPARSLCDNLTVLCDSLDIAQRLTAQIAPKQNWRVR